MDPLKTISVWKDTSCTRFFLYRHPDDTYPLDLGVNDSITWEGRDEYVKIVEIFGKEKGESGPCGFSYLPWRKEGRWASYVITLRGDARFAICYPVGFPHYGLHIPLHTVVKDDVPCLTEIPDHAYNINDALVAVRYNLMKWCHDTLVECTKLTECKYQCFRLDTTFHIRICRVLHQKGYFITFQHLLGNKTTFEDTESRFDL